MKEAKEAKKAKKKPTTKDHEDLGRHEGQKNRRPFWRTMIVENRNFSSCAKTDADFPGGPSQISMSSREEKGTVGEIGRVLWRRARLVTPSDNRRHKTRTISPTLRAFVFFVLSSWLAFFGTSCNSVSDDQLATIGEPHVWAFFNSPGSREGTQHDTLSEAALVERLDSATGTLDVCVYGFSNQRVIDAIVRAHYRGVDVRVVGDAKHFGYNERGYRILQENHIPIQVGNQFHIMHNKFFIIDDMFTFVGTGNTTETGYVRNNNNWVLIDSPLVTADFKAEFEQMWNGKFSTAKVRIENGNTYEVGDTIVEVYFSPQEDAMGRILRELELATDNIHFTIFAFTKDQVGSLFIDKHREFTRANEASGDADLPVLERPKRVVGILDRSQIHGNFLYHEVYRLTANGVPMKMDANENSRLPGDYQAGGGRLHSKTMLIDVGTPNARVITGSFNWSSSATIANDEVMLVLRGERITNEYYREFLNLWETSKTLDEAICIYMDGYDAQTGEGPKCANQVDPGDVVISEVGWFGHNGLTDPADHSGRRDPVENDEFIELYNTTNDPINLSLWTITNGSDFKVGFTPGTVIQPGQYFLVLDHNIEPYSDTNPQRAVHAYQGGDFVMNLANDPRFPRLNISDSALDLRLVDTLAREIDRAGNGLPPFAGGPTLEMAGMDYEVVNVRSMERVFEGDDPADDGTKPASWKASSVSEGGENVNPDFRDFILATPGEPNSP